MHQHLQDEPSPKQHGVHQGQEYQTVVLQNRDVHPSHRGALTFYQSLPDNRLRGTAQGWDSGNVWAGARSETTPTRARLDRVRQKITTDQGSSDRATARAATDALSGFDSATGRRATPVLSKISLHISADDENLALVNSGKR